MNADPSTKLRIIEDLAFTPTIIPPPPVKTKTALTARGEVAAFVWLRIDLMSQRRADALQELLQNNG
jgi:hypothetical protein